ncbi:MAG: hypothetical protein IAB19_00750 [Proteobacteria bacterium]|uniref:Uncharacterized protein n=1 Tax=Candidatus Avisuccinivibrio stercorigallinarum TaxID=2840704 RepID=A0A9D9DAL0_9GAMM|nr:hypothetical protein [Candidatus Avisuccinivibrio stercorigallinarum]
MKSLKLCLTWLVISLLVTLLCSVFTFLQKINFESAVNVLFTASTAMFSVSMGVIAAFSFKEVTAPRLKARILKEIDRVKHNLLFTYALAAFLLIAFFISNSITAAAIGPVTFKFTYFIITYLCLTILNYTLNFLALQNLRRDIEEYAERHTGA